MSAPVPTLGYPSKSAAASAMRRAGVSTEIVARRLGISPKDVVALECSYGRRKRKSRASEENGRTVLFPVDILDRLGPHAARRGISANELARRIVETVIDDNMVDAVLDDANEAEIAEWP